MCGTFSALSLRLLFQKLFGLNECVTLAHIKEFELRLSDAVDGYFVAMREVEVHDGKFLGMVLHHGEEAGREDVDAREGHLNAFRRVKVGVGASDFTRLNVCPPNEAHVIVEEQVALSLSLRNEEGYVVSFVSLNEAWQVGIAQDVNVVNHDGRIGREELLRMLQSAPRVKQGFALVGDEELGAPVVALDVVDNLVGKVMRIHHDALRAGADKLLSNMLKQGLTSNGDERLGHRVGQGLEACA